MSFFERTKSKEKEKKIKQIEIARIFSELSIIKMKFKHKYLVVLHSIITNKKKKSEIFVEEMTKNDN